MSIIPAKEIATIAREEIVNMFCDKIMEDIKIASADGRRSACFGPGPIYLREGKLIPRKRLDERLPEYHFKDYRDEVADKFIKAGYTIKPTGYIGGVWQLTERIHW